MKGLSVRQMVGRYGQTVRRTNWRTFGWTNVRLEGWTNWQLEGCPYGL